MFFSVIDSADDNLLVIPQLDLAALLVQQEIRRHCRYDSAPFLLVFLQRMTGQIDTDDFLFKAKLDLLAVLSNVGILNLIGFFSSSDTRSNRLICPASDFFFVCTC